MKDSEKLTKVKEQSIKKNTIDLEQKLKFMTTEVKRQEAWAEKAEKQLWKFMDQNLNWNYELELDKIYAGPKVIQGWTKWTKDDWKDSGED